MTDLITDTSTQSVGIAAPEAKDDQWRGGAVCAQTDPEAFFPDKGGTAGPAKAICQRCPVRYECLWTALETRERFGVWGGLSERQRKRFLQLTAAVTGPEPDHDSALEFSALVGGLDLAVIHNWLATPSLLVRLLRAPLDSDLTDLDLGEQTQLLPRTITDPDGYIDIDLTERLAG